MNRRYFLRCSALAAGYLAAASPVAAPVNPRSPRARPAELRIRRIVVQEARGRRLTPVAPNAYAAYRGYAVREPVLRIQADHGLEGIAHRVGKPEGLQPLIGRDVFKLFEWAGDTVRAPAAEHRLLLAPIQGADIALFDLLGRTLQRPVADLLGKRCRPAVTVYDSSLYMEDLLKAEERRELVYLNGKPPADPLELVARKAEWILAQPEAVRTLKIKIGRAKWMPSFDVALARDIAVFKAVRQTVGRDVVLLVDGNDGYRARPLAAAEFAEAVRSEDLFAMEEMFPEQQLEELREVKRRLRSAGMKTKLADGENHLGGLPEALRAERFVAEGGSEPLFDLDQGDMNQAGYLRLLESARACARHGLTLAPHNFGSKLGLYAMIHLGLVTPNWEFCESDDTRIPALEPAGFEIRKGLARLTGLPGLGIRLQEAALEKPSLELA